MRGSLHWDARRTKPLNTDTRTSKTAELKGVVDEAGCCLAVSLLGGGSFGDEDEGLASARDGALLPALPLHIVEQTDRRTNICLNEADGLISNS